MVYITEHDKNIWKSDSIPKTLTIRFPDKNITLSNEDILAESLELTETIEDREQLSFTGCYASQIKFDCATFEEDVRNERIEVVLKADGAADMPLFKGWVYEQQRQDYEDETCTIIAYDDFYRLNTLDLGEWYEGLTFPMTQLAFRTALAQQAGIQMVNVSLIFDDLVLNKTIESSRVFASTFIKAICQLNGVFGRINREGKLDFVSLVIDDSLYPSEELYPSEDIYPMEGLGEEIDKAYYTSIKHEGYEVEAIDKVQIHENPDDIGGVYGPGTNAYIVENNWMTYGRSGEELDRMAQTLYEKVGEYTYMPAEIECIGLPYLECGDFIEACTAKSYVFSYILSRTLKGIQALQDEYKAEGSKLREKAVSDVHEEIVQLKSQYNAMSRTVEGTYNEVYYKDKETGEYKSRIDQNAHNITLKVDGETYNQDKTAMQTDIDSRTKKAEISLDISNDTGKINIASNRISIQSDYFELTEEGEITATAGHIAGWEILEDAFSYAKTYREEGKAYDTKINFNISPIDAKISMKKVTNQTKEVQITPEKIEFNYKDTVGRTYSIELGENGIGAWKGSIGGVGMKGSGELSCSSLYIGSSQVKVGSYVSSQYIPSLGVTVLTTYGSVNGAILYM